MLDKAPTIIANLFQGKIMTYNLRGINLLSLPKANDAKYGLKSFHYSSV